MSTQSPETPKHEGLPTRPTDEREIYRTLLAANRTAERAAAAGDIDGLDRAIAIRRRIIEELRAQESQRAAPSFPAHVGHPGLPEGTAPRAPERLVAAWLVSERRAGEAIRKSVDLVRTRIRGVDAGRQGLKGYRGSAVQLPRFADRKG